MSQQPPDRLREHPRERFAADEAVFDLEQSAAQLRAESQAGQHGHRQQVLYRRGRTTVALFVFEQNASLPPHTADGAVIIHAIDGQIELRTDNDAYELARGSIATLAPGVRHSVTARRPSVMLLTVCLKTDEKPEPVIRESSQ